MLKANTNSCHLLACPPSDREEKQLVYCGDLTALVELLQVTSQARMEPENCTSIQEGPSHKVIDTSKADRAQNVTSNHYRRDI